MTLTKISSTVSVIFSSWEESQNVSSWEECPEYLALSTLKLVCGKGWWLVPLNKQTRHFSNKTLYLKYRLGLYERTLFYQIRTLGWHHSPRHFLSRWVVTFGFIMSKRNLLFARSPEGTAHLKRKDLRQVKKYIFCSPKKSINTINLTKLLLLVLVKHLLHQKITSFAVKCPSWVLQTTKQRKIHKCTAESNTQYVDAAA